MHPSMMLRPWRLDEATKQAIVNMPASTPSREVAEIFGISQSTVLSLRRKHHVPIPKRGALKMWGKSNWVKGCNPKWPFTPLKTNQTDLTK